MSGEATAKGPHLPVLLDEVIEALRPAAGEVHVDGTFGAGGYSRRLLECGVGRVIGIDRDPTAIAGARALVDRYSGRLTLVHGGFGDLDRHAREAGYAAVDGVVLDIGVSSMQLDTPERGFSFRHDGPLDMRMARTGVSAADVVNTMGERELTDIIRLLGEEKRARSVARAIVEARRETPIATTAELAALVERVVRRKPGDRIHPATRTFQALRIFVNRELEELAKGLAAAERLLKEGGRLVVVAFHSLEDRIVKRFFASRSETGAGGSRHRPAEVRRAPSFELLRRRPVEAGEEEIDRNPRARSARLRAAIRTGAPAWPFETAALGLPRLPDQPSMG